MSFLVENIGEILQSKIKDRSNNPAKNQLLEKISIADTADSEPDTVTATVNGIKLQVHIQNESQSSSGLSKDSKTKSAVADVLLDAGINSEKIDALKKAGVTDITMDVKGNVTGLVIGGIKTKLKLARDLFATVAGGVDNLGAILDELKFLKPEDQVKVLALLARLNSSVESLPKRNSNKDLLKQAVKDAINKSLLESYDAKSEIYKILSEIFLEESIIEKMIDAWEEQMLADRIRFEEDLDEKAKEKIIDEKEKIAHAQKSLMSAIMVGDITKMKEAASILIANGALGAISSELKSDKSLEEILKDIHEKQNNNPDTKKSPLITAPDQRIARIEDMWRYTLGIA